MSVVEALVVPSAPLLVPAVAAGSADVDADLRSAVRTAVATLLAGPEPVLVVGEAERSGLHQGAWDWRGLGLPARHAQPLLPLALAVGDWLIDDVDPARPRTLVGVDPEQDAAACAAQGRDLVGEQDVRLLVVGDGSARRSEKAPGSLDPRAEGFDAQAERALAAGDLAALLELSPSLARELLAAGRGPWQLLAGAVDAPVRGELLWSGAPYGVAYLVARWSAA